MPIIAVAPKASAICTPEKIAKSIPTKVKIINISRSIPNCFSFNSIYFLDENDFIISDMYISTTIIEEKIITVLIG